MSIFKKALIVSDLSEPSEKFLSEIFLGSVSHHVARHAPVPTLLIPALR